MKSDPELFKEQYENTILFQRSSKKDYPKQENILVKIIMKPEYLRKYEALENTIKEGLLRNDEGEITTNAFMVKLRTASNKLEGCAKCDKALKIIERGEKTVFFSEFKSHGTEVVMDMLKKRKIKYYIITGSVSMENRNKIVEKFNSYGDDIDKCNLLIITKAGAEGLDLKGVRNVIIFEQGWNCSGEEQVIGRAVRYRSHNHLPPKQRTVKIWYMVAIKPQGTEFENRVFNLGNRGDEVTKNFKKKIIVNEKYKKPSPSPDEISKSDIAETFGADAYMFLQSIEKLEKNLELEEELEKIQISLKKKNSP